MDRFNQERYPSDPALQLPSDILEFVVAFRRVKDSDSGVSFAEADFSIAINATKGTTTSVFPVTPISRYPLLQTMK